MVLSEIKSPCKGCKDRVIEPTCHSAERCEKWRIYEEAKKREYDDRLKAADADVFYFKEKHRTEKRPKRRVRKYEDD